MERIDFLSYTQGIPVIFSYVPQKGIQWRRDILKAIQKALLKEGLIVNNRQSILVEGLEDINLYKSISKYLYDFEIKEFVKY